MFYTNSKKHTKSSLPKHIVSKYHLGVLLHMQRFSPYPPKHKNDRQYYDALSRVCVSLRPRFFQICAEAESTSIKKKTAAIRNNQHLPGIVLIIEWNDNLQIASVNRNRKQTQLKCNMSITLNKSALFFNPHCRNNFF